MTRRNLLIGGGYVAGAGLAGVARSLSWHTYIGSGFTAPSGIYDRILIAGAVLMVVLGFVIAVRQHEVVVALAELAATVLTGVILGGLVILGEPSDTPDAGAWVAGGAVLVLGGTAAASRLRQHIGAATAVCVVLAIGAACAVALSPVHNSPDEITIIR